MEWWNSQWGPGPLLTIALPLMISTGFISLTLFTDRMLLYWQSDEAAAAAMEAGSLYWTIICLPNGLIGYVSIFVAQYFGAQQWLRIGVAYRHTLRIAWMVAPVLLACMVLAPWIFAATGHGPELRGLETLYLQVLLVGGLATLVYSAQSGLLTGLGRTSSVMWMDGLAALVNLILDWVLIFGFGPIPAMGVMGAAVATAISFWIKVPIAHWIIHSNRPMCQQMGIELPCAWEWDMLRRIFVSGTPSGMQMLAEAGAFTLIMFQVGGIGELPMAATTLALSLNALAFVPIMGLGIGVGVLVGQRLTENSIDLAQRTVNCGLAIATVYTGMFACLLGAFPDAMIAIYSMGAPTERFDQVRPLLIPLLQVIAVYCVLDGFQLVFVGAIKGAGDTWFVLLATTFVSFGVVLAGIMIQRVMGGSLMLWWYVIAVWVALMLVAFGGRYAQGKWKAMRVIENEFDIASD